MNNKTTDRKRFLLRCAIHVLALGLLFVLPEILMGVGMVHESKIQWRFYAKAIIYVGVFYAEYCIVLRGRPDKLLFNWRFAAENLLLIVVGTTLVWGMHPPMPPGPAHHAGPNPLMWFRDLGIIVLTISLAVAMKLSERIRVIEERRREMDDARRREELLQLKSQLNPHFLFNALNTIYALTEIDAAKARTAVHTLSRMLRYALYEADRHTVKLSRELEFVNDYVRLMEMRLAGSVGIETIIECDNDAGELSIAPMLFISLVENAFKHGVTGRHDDMISIHINANSDGLVECTVVNRIKESNDPDSASDGEHSGLGIANLRRRLELIYGESAALSIIQADGLHAATLTVNIAANAS